jgi:plasmid stability protein
MSALVIKNFPEELHARLKAQAQRHHRSVTKEVVSLIESVLAAPRRSPKLSPPLKLEGGYRPTIEEIEAAIADDRYVRFGSLEELNEYMDELRKDRDVDG